jgi:hypothetical protein
MDASTPLLSSSRSREILLNAEESITVPLPQESERSRSLELHTADRCDQILTLIGCSLAAAAIIDLFIVLALHGPYKNFDEIPLHLKVLQIGAIFFLTLSLIRLSYIRFLERRSYQQLQQSSLV